MFPPEKRCRLLLLYSAAILVLAQPCRNCSRARPKEERNERGPCASRPDPASGGEDHSAALADHWLDLRGNIAGHRLHSPGSILPRLLARLYVLARGRTWFNGDSHDPALNRRRLGNGDPQNSGRGHAHIAFDGSAVYSPALGNAQALCLGPPA